MTTTATSSPTVQEQEAKHVLQVYKRMPVVFDRGEGTRYRSLGCEPCTGCIRSTATTPTDIIAELKRTTTAERAGRAQDQEDPHAMEKLRREGYM